MTPASLPPASLLNFHDTSFFACIRTAGKHSRSLTEGEGDLVRAQNSSVHERPAQWCHCDVRWDTHSLRVLSDWWSPSSPLLPWHHGLWGRSTRPAWAQMASLYLSTALTALWEQTSLLYPCLPGPKELALNKAGPLVTAAGLNWFAQAITGK